MVEAARALPRRRCVAPRWWTPGDVIALEADHAHEVLSLNGTEALSVHVYSRRSVRSDSERSRRQPELALMRLPWATVFWRRPFASGSIACPVTLELPGRSRWAIG